MYIRIDITIVITITPVVFSIIFSKLFHRLMSYSEASMERNVGQTSRNADAYRTECAIEMPDAERGIGNHRKEIPDAAHAPLGLSDCPKLNVG